MSDPILPARGRAFFAGAPSFTRRHRLLRAMWAVVWLLLASWTPRQARAWRALLLRAFGAQIGPGAQVFGSARIWYPANLALGVQAVIGPGVRVYSMAPIRLGARAIVSQRAHLCAGSHRVDDPDFQLEAHPITIGADAWVAAEAFVGPGVTLGEGAVLGARGVACRDLAAWTVHIGNPARPTRPRERFNREPGVAVQVSAASAASDNRSG